MLYLRSLNSFLLFKLRLHVRTVMYACDDVDEIITVVEVHAISLIGVDLDLYRIYSAGLRLRRLTDVV